MIAIIITTIVITITLIIYVYFEIWEYGIDGLGIADIYDKMILNG